MCVCACVRLNEHWCVCVRVFYMCLKTPFTHHYIPHRGKLKTSKWHQNAQMKHFMCGGGAGGAGGGISLRDKFHFRLEVKPAVSLREQAAVTARRFPQVSPGDLVQLVPAVSAPSHPSGCSFRRRRANAARLLPPCLAVRASAFENPAPL